MSGEGAERTRGSWRQAAPAGARRRRRAGTGWRRESDGPAQASSQAWDRGPRLAAGFLGLAVCAGTLAWVLSLLAPPRPVALYLVGADYFQNLAVPHNAQGSRALDDLEALAPPAQGLVRSWWARRPLVVRQTIRALRSGQLWSAGLDQIRERTTIVYFALHGAADDDGEFELRWIPSVPDVRDIPTEGKNLVVVAAVGKVLNFRIFDSDGKIVVDTEETRLTGQGQHIEDLRKQLQSLWPRPEPTRSEKDLVISAVTSIVGHTNYGPYLLLDDASVDNLAQGKVLRVRQILDETRKYPDRQFVIVFDATLADRYARLGIVRNRFVESLRPFASLLQQTYPNVVVLCSSADGQRSRVDFESGQTFFARALVRGLSGAVAARDPITDRVDVLSLFNYIKSELDPRGDGAQRPILLGADRPEIERRARSILLLAPGRYTRTTAPELAPTLAGNGERLARLETDWNTLKDPRESARLLAQRPHAWRTAVEWLLRIEQLSYVVADAPASSAPREAKRLEAVEDEQLARARDQLWRPASPLIARSARNTIALSALGEPDRVPPADAQLLEELDDVEKLAEKLGDDPSRPLAYFRPLLEEFAAGATPDRAAFLRQALGVLNQKAPFTPAESHFLSMLSQDAVPGLFELNVGPTRPESPQPVPALAETAGPRLVPLAVRVRMEAERAALGLPTSGPVVGHAHLPRIIFYVHILIEEADRVRQRGEDLLFSGDQADWARARELLRRASELYQAASASAQIRREALETRDVVQGWLPELARWVDRSPGPERHDDTLFVIAERMHGLSDQLDRPEQAATADESAVADLRKQTSLLREPFLELSGHYRKRLRELVVRPRPVSLSPEDTDEIRAILEVPPLVWRPSSGGSEPWELDDIATLLAERRHLWGLLAVGPESSQESTAPAARPGDRALRTARILQALVGRDCVAEPNDPEDLHALESGIASHLRSLPDKIDERLKPRRQAGTDPDPSLLFAADALARRAEGSQPLALEPAERLRDRLGRAWLEHLARRTYREHWQAEDPTRPPYFRQALETYLEDLQAIEARDGGPRDHAAEFPLNEQLALSGPGRIDLTSERGLPAAFRLGFRGEPDVIQGYPVVWVEVETPEQAVVDALDTGELRSVDGSTPPPSSRRAARLDPDRSVQVVASLSSPWLIERSRAPLGAEDPRPRDVKVALRAYHRGLEQSQEVSLRLHPWPEVTLSQRVPPPTADLAVEADPNLIARVGRGDGALAIVLDCSGSMSARTRSDPPLTKYQEATRALRQVLARVPKGTTLSLWTFGQAVRPDGRVDDVERQSVANVLPAVSWTGDPNQLNALMTRVESQEPWNNSPILHTMIRARADLLSIAGPKTLLVLTDGEDDRFRQDARFNEAKRDIPTALREEFGSAGIRIVFVTYKAANQQQELARKQFQGVEELPTPGKLYEVQDAANLALTLERALRPNLHLRLEDAWRRPVADMTATTADRDDPRWVPGGLRPAPYVLAIESDQASRQNLVLDRGDRLLARLEERGARVEARPTLFSDFVFQRTARERSGWRLALLENTALDLGRNGASLRAILEKLPDARAPALRLIKPRVAWLEVTPNDGSGPIYQRWASCFDLPAPSWGGLVPSWPASGAASRLEVWWDPEDDPEAALWLDYTPGRQSLDELARSYTIGSDDVSVESVSIERLAVDPAAEVVPGLIPDGPNLPDGSGAGVARPLLDCLVFRLRFPEGRPHWVQPVGLPYAGSEHRFYLSAGKYTGVFARVTRDQAQDTLRGLKFYSLTDFKGRAEGRGYYLRLDPLGTPAPSAVPPPPAPAFLGPLPVTTNTPAGRAAAR